MHRVDIADEVGREHADMAHGLDARTGGVHQLVSRGAADAQLGHDTVRRPVKRAVTMGDLVDHGSSFLFVGISDVLELTVVSRDCFSEKRG